MEKPYTITPLNESAALVSFGNVIDESVNQRIIFLHQLLTQKPFKGFIESVPGYSSLAIFYIASDVIQDNIHLNTAFEGVKEHVKSLLAFSISNAQDERQTIEIPVLYDGEDLEFIAGFHQLSRDTVVALHTAKTYRVFMIGFLPGFPYMGTVDERIAIPRKSSPRTRVPAGSVGIAGFQTGIYPQASPGGWQLVGRTPLQIFDTQKSAPCSFNPGDQVQFYAISPIEFEKLNEY